MRALASRSLAVMLALAAPARAGERIIANFPTAAHNLGIQPAAALLAGPDGSLYGATPSGGAGFGGTVFRLSPPLPGTANWRRSVLYSFLGGTDGAAPGELAMDAAGNLYGTTNAGGNLDCYAPIGCGTVFSLAPPASGKGAWTKTTLLSFSRGPVDGAFPVGGLLIGPGGVLYGTTKQGSAGSTADSGTVFALTPPSVAGGAWSETVLWTFGQSSGSDVSGPYAGLTAGPGGVLYGTGGSTGAHAVGGVFALAPPSVAGGAWTESVLYSFKGGQDGAFPYEGRLLLNGGALFGTTLQGGAANNGTVFRLTPPPLGGAWTETQLYAFPASSAGTGYTPHGFGPLGGVVADAAGALYGTTYSGGLYCNSGSCNGVGVLYKLAPLPPGRHGHWQQTVLHTFKYGTIDGWSPEATPVWQSPGVLAGTTRYGGNAAGCTATMRCGMAYLQTVP